MGVINVLAIVLPACLPAIQAAQACAGQTGPRHVASSAGPIRREALAGPARAGMTDGLRRAYHLWDRTGAAAEETGGGGAEMVSLFCFLSMARRSGPIFLRGNCSRMGRNKRWAGPVRTCTWPGHHCLGPCIPGFMLGAGLASAAAASQSTLDGAANAEANGTANAPTRLCPVVILERGLVVARHGMV